jgi:SlyX protein
MSDERLIEVEIKLTEQEQLLETLNQVVIAQQREIDFLRSRVDIFERMLANMEESPANERPPHY